MIVPGTKNSEHFRNLTGYSFVFLLCNDKAQLLKRVCQPVDRLPDGDITNVEVNKPYKFLMQLEKLPQGLFVLIENVKFENATANVEANEKPVLKK